MISWLVGRRDQEYAEAFIGDPSSQLSERIQLTTDEHRAYLMAVDKIFGGAIDYAMLAKIYSGQECERRCSPASFVKSESAASLATRMQTKYQQATLSARI